MKALVLKDYRRFELQDIPAPRPAADEVLVRVIACGICGSDVHGMDGSTGRRRPPLVMGHEAAGIVAALGAAVAGWKIGDRVTFDSTVYCGACEHCRRGEVNLCHQRRVLGVSCDEYKLDGAFAEFVAVPTRILYRLPDSLSFEHAALVEPFAIALHAVERVQAKLNDTALVIGCGMIGLAIIQMLRCAGYGRILAVDTAEDRLRQATQLGADVAIDTSRSDPLDDVLEATHRRGVDHVFEAVGARPTVDLAVRAARKGGTVTLVGNVSPTVELPLQWVVTRELSLFGSCASAGEYPACLDLMARRKITAESLLSAVAPLEQGPDWFERLHRREPGLLKVVLAPSLTTEESGAAAQQNGSKVLSHV